MAGNRSIFPVVLLIFGLTVIGSVWLLQRQARLQEADGPPAFVEETPQAPVVFPWKTRAYWSFDEETLSGEQVNDLGPDGRHAKLLNRNDKRPSLVKGIRGEALRFPPGHESWLEVNPAPSMQPPFTIAAWVRLGSRQGTMEIIGQKAHSWQEGIRLEFSVRRFSLEYSDGVERLTVTRERHQAAEGQWVYLAVVHDGESITLYLDGREEARETAKTMKLSGRPMLLGNYVVAKDSYRFVGQLDEVMILDAALSQDDIIDLGMMTLGKQRGEKRPKR